MNASAEVKREEMLDELGWQFNKLLRELPVADADALADALVRRDAGELDAVQYELGADGALLVHLPGGIAYALQSAGAGALRYATSDEETTVELFSERTPILGPVAGLPPAAWNDNTGSTDE